MNVSAGVVVIIRGAAPTFGPVLGIREVAGDGCYGHSDEAAVVRK